MTKEAGRKHLLKSNDSISWYAFEHPKASRFGAKDACYATFREYEPKDYVYLGVGYYCAKSDIAGMAFLSWITGPSSPWRSLLIDPIEIIENGDFIHGFFVGPETLKKAPRQVLMNWLIATRGWNEFQDHIRFWFACVEEGIDPDQAYMYARDFAYYGPEDIRLKTVHNLNHWPWCGTPDWERILKSKPKLGGKYTNSIFSADHSPSYEGSWETYKKILKGNMFNIEDIKAFHKDPNNVNRKLS